MSGMPSSRAVGVYWRGSLNLDQWWVCCPNGWRARAGRVCVLQRGQIGHDRTIRSQDGSKKWFAWKTRQRLATRPNPGAILSTMVVCKRVRLLLDMPNAQLPSVHAVNPLSGMSTGPEDSEHTGPVFV